MRTGREGFPLNDAIHDNIALVDAAVWNIETIANGLYNVGLDRAADRLSKAIDGLRASATAIADSHIDDVNGQISHGREMMGGLITAALNGNLVPSKAARS